MFYKHLVSGLMINTFWPPFLRDQPKKAPGSNSDVFGFHFCAPLASGRPRGALGASLGVCSYKSKVLIQE